MENDVVGTYSIQIPAFVSCASVLYSTQNSRLSRVYGEEEAVRLVLKRQSWLVLNQFGKRYGDMLEKNQSLFFCNLVTYQN